jgi:hypothetical protein
MLAGKKQDCLEGIVKRFADSYGAHASQFKSYVCSASVELRDGVWNKKTRGSRFAKVVVGSRDEQGGSEVKLGKFTDSWQWPSRLDFLPSFSPPSLLNNITQLFHELGEPQVRAHCKKTSPRCEGCPTGCTYSPAADSECSTKPFLGAPTPLHRPLECKALHGNPKELGTIREHFIIHTTQKKTSLPISTYWIWLRDVSTRKPTPKRPGTY